MLLLAVAGGVAVANLYYAQPLAAQMAVSFGVSAGAIGTALVATQIGYTLGMTLLVPLGDGRERRRVIVMTVVAAVPALLLLSIAPNVPVLAVSSLIVGLVSSVPQMILPYAVNLLPNSERGRVVGTIMSGLLIGILLSRTASGALGQWLGWRSVFITAAALMAVLAFILRASIPEQQPEARIPWTAIMKSLVSVWRTQPILRRRAVVGGMGFASFSVFWSTLSFQLAKVGYGSAMAGTFGVIGIAGVIVAPQVARRATGEHPSRFNVVSLVAIALSFGVFAVFSHSLVGLGVGVVLLDAGVQANHLTNQTVIFGVAPELRSRLNALYMVGYFIGGSIGTAVAAAAWSFAGWPAVCAVGAALALVGILPLLGTPI
jgi:predicted MFS family arabinose efflux permease